MLSRIFSEVLLGTRSRSSLLAHLRARGLAPKARAVSLVTGVLGILAGDVDGYSVSYIHQGGV